jgi:hypothetical protein
LTVDAVVVVDGGECAGCETGDEFDEEDEFEGEGGDEDEGEELNSSARLSSVLSTAMRWVAGTPNTRTTAARAGTRAGSRTGSSGSATG